MNKKFEVLLTLLNNEVKQNQFRALYNSATNLQKIELIGTLKEFLNISEASLNDIINNTLNKL